MTNDKQTELINKEFHPEAEKLAKDYISEFATTLIIQAKLSAFRKRAEMILCGDVDDALKTITTQHSKKWKRELAVVFGGALFGVFLKDFFTTIISGNAFLIVAYTILGFAGMVLVIVGIRR